MNNAQRILELKAKLTDMGQEHAAHVGQAQQAQQMAANIERECLKIQGQIEMLQADAKETPAA